MNIDRTLQNHVLHFLKSHYDDFIEDRLIYDVCINGTEYRITHKGIDFIEDDGGLSAILNVSTVKLHPSSVELLISVIDGSSLNPSDKQKMIDQLKSLPADSIKQILTELVNKGVDYLPALFASFYM